MITKLGSAVAVAAMACWCASILHAANGELATEDRSPSARRTVPAATAEYRHAPGEKTAAVAVDWSGYRGIRRYPVYGWAPYAPLPAYSAAYYYRRPWYVGAYAAPYSLWNYPSAYGWPAAYGWGYRSFGWGYAGGWPAWGAYGDWAYGRPGCLVMLGQSAPIGDSLRPTTAARPAVNSSGVNSSPAATSEDEYSGCYYW